MSELTRQQITTRGPVTLQQEPIAPAGRRRLSYGAFAVIVIAYLALIQIGGLLVTRAAGIASDRGFVTTHNVLISLWIPVGAALIFTYAVIAILGWQQLVFRDDRPVQRWVLVVPVVFAAGIILATDYNSLASKGLGFTLILLIGTQFVGWGEEGMFRGVGVTVLRDHGLREGQVALWSSVIFGIVHLTNAIGHGASAIPQAIAVSLAGYFFYLMRRVSRGNVLNSVIHGLFDFSIVSGTTIIVNQRAYAGSVAAILVYVILIVVLLARRHRIELPAVSQSGSE
jgi:uncharacterized protein